MTEYRVTWQIDVEASSPEEAARRAKKYQQRPHRTGAFEVIDDQGKTIRVDLDADVYVPEAAERFHHILAEMGELHDRKAADYGQDEDPLANVKASQRFGVPAWVGCMIRANDKMTRIQTFAQKGELANEGVVDSFMDLAVYAILARILYEQNLGGQL